MKNFAKLKEMDFVIPVVVLAIASVFVWNTFISPWISPKIGKDLSA